MEDAEHERAQPKLRVLFVQSRLKFVAYLAVPLEQLVADGHDVVLLLGDRRCNASEQAWLDAFVRHESVTCIIDEKLWRDPLRKPAQSLRRAAEYLRLAEPEYAERATYRRRKSAVKAPGWALTLLRQELLRSRSARTAARAVVGVLDRAMPMPGAPEEYVRKLRPDVVLVCDPGRPGSLYSAYVRAARRARIPVALVVASWDNLTTRQRTRVLPDRMLVWNEWQVGEAVDLHGMPREGVIATGAPRFDEWFDRTPGERAAFMERVGLDPGRPYVLWVGGALFPAERTEPEYLVDWLGALRASDDSALRSVGVLARPHPFRAEAWNAVDFSGFENVAVYPRGDLAMPVDAEQRSAFFDSIHHSAAVLGLNSSAMIEAAIIGRPVLTPLVEEFRESQVGTFHFAYLLEENGGPVRVGHTLDEHLAQLSEVLAGGRDEELAHQSSAFVARFVRPHGLDRPAAPIFGAAVEELARVEPTAYREPAWVPPLRAAIAFYLRARAAIHYRRNHR